eukprot:gnl/Trimastix_PCT/2623.p1 GENE.gnl/Trimastix_PCT/2623~~gnl/Trimastix_PCT/2623.p1  ORF type:complete len:287 (+),score=74.93 gnl/Trimastix_PCT/2623:38-898(+)
MHCEVFYHEATYTLSYIVHDPASRKAAIIDPCLDFDLASGKTATLHADKQIKYIQENNLQVEWILETHAHADHLTSADYLKQQLGCRIGIGAGITRVQQTFKSLFNIPDSELTADGSCFDKLFADGETFQIGAIDVHIMSTPGHTNDSVTYVMNQADAFVGDTLFMPDGGSARCDFPGGDASLLYDSVQKIHALPPECRIWVCHDYQPAGRALAYQTTVQESREHNIHLNQTQSRENFVSVRTTRDAKLAVPRFILPSVQINIRAGRMPLPEANGTSYIKIPINRL